MMNVAGMIQSAGETPMMNAAIARMRVEARKDAQRRGRRGKGRETFMTWERGENGEMDGLETYK